MWVLWSQFFIPISYINIILTKANAEIWEHINITTINPKGRKSSPSADMMGQVVNKPTTAGKNDEKSVCTRSALAHLIQKTFFCWEEIQPGTMVQNPWGFVTK